MTILNNTEINLQAQVTSLNKTVVITDNQLVTINNEISTLNGTVSSFWSIYAPSTGGEGGHDQRYYYASAPSFTSTQSTNGPTTSAGTDQLQESALYPAFIPSSIVLKYVVGGLESASSSGADEFDLYMYCVNPSTAGHVTPVQIYYAPLTTVGIPYSRAATVPLSAYSSCAHATSYYGIVITNNIPGHTTAQNFVVNGRTTFMP